MATPLDPRLLLDALDEPALVVDGASVRIANRSALALLGAEIEGGDVRLAIRHPDALTAIKTGDAAQVDVTSLAGFERPWTLAISPMAPGVRLVRLLDRSAAVAADKIRVDFVANASHELRTPLSSILGYSETIADDPGGKLVARFGQTIRDEAARMLRIIEDLMSLSRIEADRFAAPRMPVDLSAILDTCIDNAKLLAQSRCCRIELEHTPDLPAVQGDPAQLSQLFDNLLINAIRYGCQEDGGSIGVSTALSRGFVEVSITDYGPGIPAAHISRLTERFYRVDEGRSRDAGGTGLGLAIVKHIVERHRGTLQIRSAVDEGTTVTVGIPAFGSLSH